MKKVFLGGTCGYGHDWREGFIKQIDPDGTMTARGEIFNPLLPKGQVWDEEAQAREDAAKRCSVFSFFGLGNPAREESTPVSLYSTAQIIDSIYAKKKTIMFVDLKAIGDAFTVKALTKMLADISKSQSAVFCNDWASFVTAVQEALMDTPQMLGFLGGTCGNNPWREHLLDDLAARGVNTKRLIDPVVPPGTWTAGVKKLEDQIRPLCDTEIFYIGDPMEERKDDMQFSTYSVVEALVCLYNDPRFTVVAFDYEGITGHVLDAYKTVEADMRKRFPKGLIFSDLESAAEYLRVRLQKM